MKKLNLKSKISTISLILLLAISAIIVTFPAATAQGTWQTWPLVDLTPNPVGVNQEVLVILGITSASAWPQAGWEGLTVTVTKPDGNTETLGPFMTDTTGMTGSIYIPTMAGTYQFQTHFPAQLVTAERAGRSIPIGTTMLAGDSDVIDLVVEEEPIDFFPAAQSPDGYWTRPIDTQNREWYTLAGSWLDGAYKRTHYNRAAPFNDGPETAHILWDKPLAEGGLVGGDQGWFSFETGDAYEGKWANPVIIAGVLISNRHVRGTQETFAINLRTGEELWSKHLGDSIDFGSLHYWDTMNMHGVWAYIWSTQGNTWRAWDPLTGRNDYNMTNVPGGTRVPGPNGEIMRYDIDVGDATISIWNSTAAFYDRQLVIEDTDEFQVYHAGRWRPFGQEFDAGNGTQYTGTIPAGLLGGVELIIPGDRAIGSNTEWAGNPQQDFPQYWAIDLRPGHIGELIFNEPWPLPEANLHVDFTGSHPYSVEDGVFIVTAKETRQHWALSMDTGKQVWGPTTQFEPYMNSFSNLYMDPWGQAVCADGKLLTAGFGGVVNAYDLTNGQHLWEYKLTDIYSEQLFGNNWPAPIGFVTDGKIYLFHMEHSVIQPMPRGAPAACISLETGDEIWRINGLRLGTRWGGQPIIGDSVIAAFSSYDNTITALGKGPSTTTVAVRNDIALGGSAMVLGSVMDVSPGTKDTNTMLRFPDGVPAVSDASMSEWMMYVYKTEQMPTTVTGVTVTLEAVDPNGNYQTLGTTTTDMFGNYGLMITPEVEGQYMIMASFSGSGAYYGSTDSTYLAVSPALAPETPIEPETPVETPLITTELAIIAAIAVAAVIGIASFWALRKRK